MNSRVIRVNTGCYLLFYFALSFHLNAQTTIQELGKALFFDRNLSLNKNQSCSSCHDPQYGFADPRNVILKTPVSPGSVPSRFGNLNAPSASYAAFSPHFHWDGDEGLFKGGQFWNGRASTLAEQAAGPFLNPVEMAMPDKWSVVERLKVSKNPDYQTMFDEVFNIDLSAIKSYERSENELSNSTPEAQFPPGVRESYLAMTKAIAEFEKSIELNPFNSKYDYYLARQTQLSDLELEGLRLFEGKGKCSQCHPSEPTLSPYGKGVFPPMFTDFTYDNLGLPENVNIPNRSIDLGLGGRSDIKRLDPYGFQIGKHKVMTLRNIELTPPYGHNGIFATLEEIVHFYNTRDTLGVCTDNNDTGFGVTCWPKAEVAQNINVEELGDLGLTPSEEAAIVAFLKTLTDGWGPANNKSPLSRPPIVPLP